MSTCLSAARVGRAAAFAVLLALVVPAWASAQSALPPHPCQISVEMCVDYTKQQADNDGLLFDEGGNPSPPKYVGPAEIAPMPLSASAGSLSAYLENVLPDATGGLLAGESETASHRDAPVDHCTPYGPAIDHRKDSQRQGANNYYVAAVGVSCDAGVQVHCWIEIWRVHDQHYWTDGHPESGTRPESCYAQTVSSFYEKRKGHYAVGHLRMSSDQGVWKRDPGSAQSAFEGWRCNGFKSKVLDCTRRTDTIS
jgi:hypothetical protein